MPSNVQRDHHTWTRNTVKNISGDMTLDITGGDLIIDSEYSIIMNIGGAGPYLELDAVSSTFKIHHVGDTGDYFRILVGSNGYSKFSTNDNSDNNLAYLNINPEGDLWLKPITGDTLVMATKKLHFDGESKTTYITESADDVLDIYVGDDNMLKLTEHALGNRVSVLGSNLTIDSGQYLLFDGDGLGNTSIRESSADQLDFLAGGITMLSLDMNSQLSPSTNKVSIPALTPLYFDAGNDTYIAETSADRLDCFVGDVRMLRLSESGAASQAIIAADVRLTDYDGSTYSSTNSGSVQTKAQIDAAIDVHTTVVEISEAEMDALHTTGKELVAAQGGSNVVIPIDITIFVQRDASIAQAASTNLCFGANDATVLGANVWSFIKRFMYNESDDRILKPSIIIPEVAQAIDEMNNRSLTAKLDGAITTGSINAMRVISTYYVYDNS